MSHFLFNEADHSYVIGGEPGIPTHRVPSVTQVLDAVGMSPDLSHLPIYYRERGRAIHSAMALHLHGTLDSSTLDERIVPFLDNGRRWLDNIAAVPLVVEHRWVHTELEYGGTQDLFCDTSLGPLLVDWKSTFHDPSYDVQVAGGYEPLLFNAATAGAVAVDPEQVAAARIAVVTLKQPMGKTHWCGRHGRGGVAHADTFRSALSVVRWRTEHNRGEG